MSIRWVTGITAACKNPPNKPLCLKHQECFWFSSQQAMGRRTHGQVLYSILLVRGFGQGMGSPISGSLVSTDVQLPTPKAGCLPPPNPSALRCRTEGMTDWQEWAWRWKGEKGNLAPESTCCRGEWGCLALKAFYRPHMQERKLCSVLLFMEWLNYLPLIFIDCDQPYPSGIHPQQLGGSFWQMSP